MDNVKNAYENLVADRLEELANRLSRGDTLSRTTLDDDIFIELLAGLRYATVKLRGG